MAQTTKADAQHIELELSDSSKLTFHVDTDDYCKFVNETMPNNKISPMHNFLVRTVDDADKERLQELLKNPANTTTLAGEVLEEYKPDIQVIAKKRSK